MVLSQNATNAEGLSSLDDTAMRADQGIICLPLACYCPQGSMPYNLIESL